MARRGAIVLGTTFFVVGSIGLGFNLATPLLERIPKPELTNTNRVYARIYDACYKIWFMDEVDRTWFLPLPPGHSKDKPGAGILSPDHQSILVFLQHENIPFPEQETVEMLLKHTWPKMEWELWQFSLASEPTSSDRPRLVTKLAAGSNTSPGLALSSSQVIVIESKESPSGVEDVTYYRLRL